MTSISKGYPAHYQIKRQFEDGGGFYSNWAKINDEFQTLLTQYQTLLSAVEIIEQWEYKREEGYVGIMPFDQWGKEGWELCATYNHFFYFKRKLPPLRSAITTSKEGSHE